MLASSAARNSAKLFSSSSSRATVGLYRHRAVIACAGIHTTHKTKSAVASP
jgi:acetolactate synthase-1/2/3 large subunit